jgi:hypothetical protein
MDSELVTILRWPVAFVALFVILTLIFRTPLVALIGRITSFKYGKGAVDASGGGPTLERQKDLQPPQQQTAALPATHAMPPPSIVHASMEQEIQKALTAERRPSDVEKAWLIRAVAVNHLWHTHEVTYRLITGSQINLLLRANAHEQLDMQRARELYDEAKSAFPNLYADFSFDLWVNYSMRRGLTQLDASSTPAQIRITPTGQDFLHYLVNNGLTYQRPG